MFVNKTDKMEIHTGLNWDTALNLIDLIRAFKRIDYSLKLLSNGVMLTIWYK